MNVKVTIAKLVANIALNNAKASCGAASRYGTYQPKEPKSLRTLKK